MFRICTLLLHAQIVRILKIWGSIFQTFGDYCRLVYPCTFVVFLLLQTYKSEVLDNCLQCKNGCFRRNLSFESECWRLLLIDPEALCTITINADKNWWFQTRGAQSQSTKTFWFSSCLSRLSLPEWKWRCRSFKNDWFKKRCRNFMKIPGWV